MQQENKILLVVDKTRRFIYKLIDIDKDEYENISTNKFGVISKKDAVIKLAIPITLNSMVQKNPEIINLISKLNLQLEPSNEDVNNILNKLK